MLYQDSSNMIKNHQFYVKNLIGPVFVLNQYMMLCLKVNSPPLLYFESRYNTYTLNLSIHIFKPHQKRKRGKPTSIYIVLFRRAKIRHKG